jgi:hypothetical protein
MGCDNCNYYFKLSSFSTSGYFLRIILSHFRRSWRIIMCSGFDDWIYWHLFKITINYNISNQWLSPNHSVPYWTTSVFSFYCGESRMN